MPAGCHSQQLRRSCSSAPPHRAHATCLPACLATWARPSARPAAVPHVPVLNPQNLAPKPPECCVRRSSTDQPPIPCCPPRAHPPPAALPPLRPPPFRPPKLPAPLTTLSWLARRPPGRASGLDSSAAGGRHLRQLGADEPSQLNGRVGAAVAVQDVGPLPDGYPGGPVHALQHTRHKPAAAALLCVS